MLVAAVNSDSIGHLFDLLGGDTKSQEPLRKAHCAVFNLNIGEETTANLRFDFADDESAKNALPSIHAVRDDVVIRLKKLGDDLAKEKALVSWSKPIELMREILSKQTSTKVNKSQLIVIARWKTDELFPPLGIALLDGVRFLRAKAVRDRSALDMKLLGQTIEICHDVNGTLPFIKSVEVNPGLSWRVAVLPYMEQIPLYQQFNLDEPWDSEHNKKLIEKMPRLFAPKTNVKVEKGQTFYRAFVGSGTIGNLKTFDKVPKDALAKTLMLVEGSEPIIWTKPDDIVYDPAKPLPKLGGAFDDGFYGCFGDGKVRFFEKDTPEKQLRALITLPVNKDGK